MANPLATVSFRQLRPTRDTYKADGVTILFNQTKNNGSAQVGLAVSIASNKTVQLAADAQRIIGTIEHVEPDLTCAIHVGAYVSLPTFDGNPIAAGARVCGALKAGARGYARAVAAATLADVYAASGTVVDTDASAAVGSVWVKMD